jgi:hypothetical protein
MSYIYHLTQEKGDSNSSMTLTINKLRRAVNSPGVDPSILRHSGIWGAADEAVLNNVHKKTKKPL